jgi:cyclase
MLRPRITPCLLVRNKGLVKTVNFSASKYVGDPINAVRIFNEKEVDELIVLDIDATATDRGPDTTMVAHLAAECRMPLCYGGGVKTVEQAKTVIGLGVEKVAISSAAVENPGLVSRIAAEIGAQSVVIVLDVRKSRGGSGYEVFTRNGTVATGKCPVDFARQLEGLGAGEIVINSIDRDGEMKGYDMALAGLVRDAISVPMTVLGGAGSLKHVGELVRTFGIVGAAAGSLFVFKGIYKAVLINYPSPAEKDELIRANLAHV